MSDGDTANRMWGGRFSSGPDAIMEEINASIGYDRKLYTQDIAGSKAHATMLGAKGIISSDDVVKILEGLEAVKIEIDNGHFVFKRSLEDIHMNVESRLAEIIGPAAGRLHTARSRNDQVALDFRLWVRDTLDHLETQVSDLMLALAERRLLMPIQSCPASRTCNPRSRSPSVITCLPMWRCCHGIAAVSGMRASG